MKDTLHPAMIFFLASLILAILRVISELLFVDPHIIKAHNKLMREWREEYKRAMKTKDPRLLTRVKKKKAKLDSLTMIVSKMRMKTLLINSSVAILLFWFIREFFATNIYIPLLGSLPAIAYFFVISLAVNSYTNIILKYKGYM